MNEKNNSNNINSINDINNIKSITNIADLTGTMITQPEFSHLSDEKKYYRIYLDIERLSCTVDRLPVLVPDHLLALLPPKGGKVRAVGRFISYNEKSGHLILHLYADEIIRVEAEGNESDNNEIFLHGYICKQPVVRTTPMGRKIAEVMLAVNRSNHRSDYIPCIAWGNNALRFADAEIGELINLKGRIQSRWYVKRLDEDEFEERIAYEVSMSLVNFPEREEQNSDYTGQHLDYDERISSCEEQTGWRKERKSDSREQAQDEETRNRERRNRNPGIGNRRMESRACNPVRTGTYSF